MTEQEKREKVIQGLQTCVSACNGNFVCLDCKYSHDYGGGCETRLLQDTIELLKAQEPIRPNEIRHGNVLMYYQCPACTSALRTVDRYCSQCGRKVKWG